MPWESAYAPVFLTMINPFHQSHSSKNSHSHSYQSLLELLNQQNTKRVIFYYSMLERTAANACFEHYDFFTVISVIAYTRLQRIKANEQTMQFTHAIGSDTRNPATDFLSAATLTYTIGAGITAAAGTRLALPLFLESVVHCSHFRNRT